MKNSRRKYMKGGADEEKKSTGFLGMLGLGGKKEDTNSNAGKDPNSMISDLTNTAKGALGMPQAGESMTSHLNGEIEKLEKEKIDLENKFKSDVQKMNEENKQKQEAETKKMQDDLNNKIKDVEKKISDLMKNKQEVITQSQKNLADSQKIGSTSTSVPVSVGGGRRRRVKSNSYKKNKSHKKRSVKKNKKTRKKSSSKKH